MGGGSSDAATTLLALNRLWGCTGRASACWHAGADAGRRRALLHRRHNAFVEGIGEQAHAAGAAAATFCRGQARWAIATADIFGSPLLVRDTEACYTHGLFCERRVWRSGFGRNDLQPPPKPIARGGASGRRMACRAVSATAA
jgi:4-diphosphocytidyl-2-C-methyl-D-erythritol kinase